MIRCKNETVDVVELTTYQHIHMIRRQLENSKDVTGENVQVSPGAGLAIAMMPALLTLSVNWSTLWNST